MKDELVLCVKRKNLESIFGTGLFTGFKSQPPLNEVLSLEISFIPRPIAELDSSWKQIIPYQLFSHDNRLFTYERGKKVGEKRLSGKMSVGIGGHINTTDHADSPALIYQKAILRERSEEISGGFQIISDSFMGWINDESNPVGQVHLGAVHKIVIDSTEQLTLSDQEDLREVGWQSLEQILNRQEGFETWSVLAAKLLHHDSALK